MLGMGSSELPCPESFAALPPLQMLLILLQRVNSSWSSSRTAPKRSRKCTKSNSDSSRCARLAALSRFIIVLLFPMAAMGKYFLSFSYNMKSSVTIFWALCNLMIQKFCSSLAGDFFFSYLNKLRYFYHFKIMTCFNIEFLVLVEVFKPVCFVSFEGRKNLVLRKWLLEKFVSYLPYSRKSKISKKIIDILTFKLI